MSFIKASPDTIWEFFIRNREAVFDGQVPVARDDKSGIQIDMTDTSGTITLVLTIDGRTVYAVHCITPSELEAEYLDMLIECGFSFDDFEGAGFSGYPDFDDEEFGEFDDEFEDDDEDDYDTIVEVTQDYLRRLDEVYGIGIDTDADSAEDFIRASMDLLEMVAKAKARGGRTSRGLR